MTTASATATTPSIEHTPFGRRLADAMRRHGPLCAGIDPHPGLVEAWGLAYDLAGVERFALTCVEAFAGQVAAVKPQSAFFEVFGARGVALLERVVAELHATGTLTILDVKRGDIGSTMDAYAQAFLSGYASAAPDAITLSPYLGYGSLRPAIDLALDQGRGVFVLALTSNPEGAEVQHARRDGVSVAATIAAHAGADNAAALAAGELGSVGLVVGATVGTAVQDLGIDLAASGGPILAPGLGAQGGTAQDLRRVFAGALPQVLASSSREVLGAGPDVTALREAARQSSAAIAALVAGASG